MITKAKILTNHICSVEISHDVFPLLLPYLPAAAEQQSQSKGALVAYLCVQHHKLKSI